MEDNKYSVKQTGSPDDEERRAARRKKRQRARIMAFAVLFVFAAAIIGGFVALGITIAGKFKPAAPAEVSIPTLGNELEEIQDVIEKILGPREDAPEPETDDKPNEGSEEDYDAWIAAKIDELSLEDRVMGLFIVSPEQITGVDAAIRAGDGTKEALEKYHVGGIVYDEKNIVSDDQFKEMMEKTKSYVAYETFFILKEESGNTVLGDKLGLDETKTASEIGADMDPYTAYTENTKIALYLKDYGINCNFGLIGDVVFANEDAEASESIMESRSYGGDPTVVSRMILEAVNAYKETGVTVAVGYFPGQGNLDRDPGDSVTSTSITKEQLEANQYPVYNAAVGAGANAIIVSHEYADELTTDNLPCSLSKEIYTDILRTELGYTDTILITDALNKEAVSGYYTSGEACVKALKAGADMVMCPEDIDEGINAVIEAVNSGVISEERVKDSLKRIWKAKYRAVYEAEIND